MESIILRNDIASLNIKIQGAEVTSWKLKNGKELIWQGENGYWGDHAPIMFPIVGQVKDGCIKVSTKVYPMPIPYGFARDMDFEIKERRHDRCVLQLSGNEKTRTYFPWEFRLTVIHSINAGTWHCSCTIENRSGNPMPYAFGFHPGFHCPIDSRLDKSDYFIEFEKPESNTIRRIRLTTPYRLLIQEKFPSPLQGRRLTIEDRHFEDGAVIIENLKSRCVKLKSDNSQESLSFEFSKFPILTLFTQKGADLICVEPWQGHNSPEGWDGPFEEKPGNTILQPGKMDEWELKVTAENMR